MKRFLIALLATLLVTPSLAMAQAGGPVRKPVVDIDPIQDLARTGQGDVLRQMIETTVINTGKFRIMERSEQGMSNLVREQQMAKSGLVTSNTPGKIGGFEGVDFKVYGTITTAAASTQHNYGASVAVNAGGRMLEQMGGGVFGSLGGAVRANSNCGTTTASLAVDIRIVDAKSGEEKFAKTITQTQNGGTTCGAQAQVDVPALLRTASQRASMGLVTIMYPVKVISVDGDGKILLNYGEGLLAPGDVYALYRQGQALIDPDTGAELGKSESFLGLVQVSEVTPKYSKSTAVTGFASSPPSGTVAREATPEQLRMIQVKRR